ncbi:MAG: PIN domain-containing protein [Acidobacteriota bacterium]
MSAAYVDTSYIVAVALGERRGAALARRLVAYDVLLAANLLEAELRSVLARENVSADPGELLDRISWILPDRPLSGECARVLAAGYLRGADLWHLACALFVEPEPHALAFLTLDLAQEAVARTLGFPVP